jgi:hypothetical protein
MTMRFGTAVLAGMLTIAMLGGVLYGVIFADLSVQHHARRHEDSSKPRLGWFVARTVRSF